MDPKTIFSLILPFLIFFYFLLNKKAKSSLNALNLPPGPPKLPLIGNIHQLARAKLPHHALRDLALKYGPIMHLQLGQVSAVIVSSPTLAKEVLKTNDLTFASRPKSLVSEIVLYGSSDISLGAYSDYWREMKKILTVEVLSAKRVRSFSRFREQEIEQFLEFLRATSGKPTIIREKLMEMINNLMCRTSFGDKCKQKHLLLELVEELGKLASGFYLADLFPEYGFLSIISGMRSKLTNIHKGFDKIFDEMLEERKTRRISSETTQEYFLDVLLGIKEDVGLSFPITTNNIKAIFVDIMAAGTDTSAITIEWAMAEMARNRNVMNKAQKEVREAFKGKKTIAESDLKDLSYLKLVIKETLRLHPSLPLLLPRECREQCTIDGYTIPVNTKVLVNAWACGVDPEYWDDASSFKPERFEESSVDFVGANFEFIPFGSGRRMCPGITFGLAAVEFALAQMLYYFDWQLPDGLKPKDIDMMEDEGIVAVMKVPLRLIPVPYPLI